MLELIDADKTEHLCFSVLVCAEDREARVRVASSDNVGELVAQGAHRVQMSDVNDLDFAIHLQRQNKNDLVRHP